MASSGGGSSSTGGVVAKAVIDAVLILLDNSINKKTHLLRCLVEKEQEESDERTVFVSVYDYLHFPDWNVQVFDIDRPHYELAEKARGIPVVVDQIVEKCYLAIHRDVELIHSLNCELFFSKLDAAKLEQPTPVYFLFESSEEFHKAISNGDFSTGKVLPEEFNTRCQEYAHHRTTLARRTNKKAVAHVLAAVHFKGQPDELMTFHAKISKH